ncbi:hypothetical protein GCM10023171_33460 [Microbacterium panaciterrae]|uniref:Uncharacterized protein n=1 Tax=Microbacterium panaciterrae TaxID=985759 RepID=A0ABP8PQV7_9MICO
MQRIGSTQATVRPSRDEVAPGDIDEFDRLQDVGDLCRGDATSPYRSAVQFRVKQSRRDQIDALRSRQVAERCRLAFGEARLHRCRCVAVDQNHQ